MKLEDVFDRKHQFFGKCIRKFYVQLNKTKLARMKDGKGLDSKRLEHAVQ